MQNDIIFIKIQVITIECLRAAKELLLIRIVFSITPKSNLFYGNIFENTIKGGIMTPEEAKVFENDPLFTDSLLIRKYDELAKIENMKINVSL